MKMLTCTWVRIVGAFLLLAAFCGWLISFKLDGWIASYAQSYVEKKSGFRLKIVNLQTNLREGKLFIDNLIIENPSTYENSQFLIVNQFRMRLDPLSIFTSKVVIPELIVDIGEVNFVFNKAGKLNVTEFIDSLKSPSQLSGEKESQEKEEKERSSFVIHRLLFKLNQVSLSDYRDAKLVTKRARLGIKKSINNITNAQQIALPIAADLAIFVGDYILESLLKSTGRHLTSKKLLQTLLNPVKGTLDSAKEDSSKWLDRFIPSSSLNQDAP